MLVFSFNLLLALKKASSSIYFSILGRLKMKIFFLVYIAFLLLFACSSQPAKQDSTNIVTTVPILEEPGDGSFFSQVTQVLVYNDDFYFADFPNSRLLVNDSDFKFKRQIGAAGQGPGEFSGLYSFFVNRSGIFAYDDGGKKIARLDFDGTPGKIIRMPTGSSVSTRFCVIGNHIYLSIMKRMHPITVLDFEGNVVNGFGHFYGTEKEKYARSARHLFTVQHKKKRLLLSLLETEPVLEIFQPDGKLVKKIDLSQNQYVRDRYEYIKEKYAKMGRKKSTYMLFENAYISQNRLFCLGYNRKGLPGYILQYEFKPGQLDLSLKKVFVYDTKKIKPVSMAYSKKHGLIIFNYETSFIEKMKAEPREKNI